MRKLSLILLLAAALLPALAQADDDTPTALEQPTTQTLGDILQQALESSDDLGIIQARIDQAESGLGEARANYYPQVTVTERAGRDSAYPSSARAPGDPRGTSEYVNANVTKAEINQMLFDGFKTPAEVERQKKLLEALRQRYRSASQQVIGDTLEVYLTAWRHLQALRAGVAMVEDMRRVKAKVDMQAAAGATDQTVKSYVDSRLTGATQELLKTRNAYREALFRLGYLLRQQLTPESFGFAPLMAPALQDLDTYIAIARTESPQLLEEAANKKASEQELRKMHGNDFPTLSLTSDLQDTNDVGGSIGTTRTGNAMVQLSYKLFDGFATRHGKARVRSQITESQFRLRKASRELEEDLSQAWRKAVASKQEAQLASQEATASLKVKTLRTQDVESGNGDIVRLIEAEEALYTVILHQLDLVQTLTQKRYELAISSGQLHAMKCVDGGCEDLKMEPVTYVSPVDAVPESTSTTEVSTSAVVSDTSTLLPANTTPPAEPVADEKLKTDTPITPATDTPTETPASDESTPTLPPENQHTEAPLPPAAPPAPVTAPATDATPGNPVLPDPRQSAAETVPVPETPPGPPTTSPDDDTPHDYEAPPTKE